MSIAVRVVPLPETVAAREATKKQYEELRDLWRKHPNYHTTMGHHLVEEVHTWFRTSFEELATAVLKKGDSDFATIPVDWFEAKILPYFKRSLRNLEGHHSTEDRMVFPQVRRQFPHLVAGCDELEKDHQTLHPLESVAFSVKYDIATRANAVVEFSNFLNDHLRREEMILLPITLDKSYRF